LATQEDKTMGIESQLYNSLGHFSQII